MIVFLDFDGVVHGISRRSFNEECIGHIESCLAEHDGKIVIISSWKDERPLDELVRRLQVLGERVIGKCGEEPAYTRVPREHLVDEWLKDNEHDGPWLALDDNPTWYGRHEPRVLATTPRTGFTEEDIPRLHALVKAIRAGKL